MTTRTVSNVYYLPVPAATMSFAESERRPVVSWRSRVSHVFWRLRFIGAEIRHILSVPVPAVITESPYLGQRGELTSRSFTRPATPARIIDFAAARVRRQ